MADIIHPEGKYTVRTVGKRTEVTFKGQDGNDVTMANYDLQVEGLEDWISLMQKTDAAAPKRDDVLEGHIEDAGKYGYKFKKKRQGGGNWGGGGGAATPGAIWSAAFHTAAIIMGPYAKSDSTPDVGAYLKRLDLVATKVKAAVDEHAGTDTKPAGDSNQSQLATSDKKPGIELDDLSGSDLAW